MGLLRNLEKTKGGRAGLLAALVFFSAVSVYSIRSTIHLTRTRTISREVYAIANQLIDDPPTIERVEVLVLQLHAINTAYATADVRDSLQDYTTVVEQGLVAWKSTGDSTIHSEKIREESHRLSLTLQKHR